MKIGMMWFDNDPKISLTEKIARAIDYYQKKYNMLATHIWVNPGTLGGNIVNIPTITLVTSQSILPNHFWIGTEDTNNGYTATSRHC
jgi:hypothetical protein